MTLPGKVFTSVLLLLLLFFSLFAAPTTAEDSKSPTTQLDNQNTSTNYYSATLEKLSLVYFIFSLIYLADLGYWISVVCLKLISPSHRRIHLLMSGLLVMKILTLLSVTEDKHSTTSLTSSVSDLLFSYVNQSIPILHFSIVIFLISNGWRFVKPCLQRIDEMMLRILIGAQVFAHLASIVIKFTSDWRIWEEMMFVADLITTCALIFSYLWWFMKSVGIGARLMQVRFFYLMIATYLLINRRIAFALTKFDAHLEGNYAIDDYVFMLSANMLIQLFSLVFYRVLFNRFREYFRRDE